MLAVARPPPAILAGGFPAVADTRGGDSNAGAASPRLVGMVHRMQDTRPQHAGLLVVTTATSTSAFAAAASFGRRRCRQAAQRSSTRCKRRAQQEVAQEGVLVAVIGAGGNVGRHPPLHGVALRALPRTDESAPSPHTGRPDFTGRWRMDLKSSDSLRKVLGGLGMNFILVQIVDRLAVEQEVSQTEDSLKVTVKTALRTDVFELPFDGAVTVVPGAAGGTNTQTSSWVQSAAGQMGLRTVQAVEGAVEQPDGAVLFETLRSLGDQGSTLFEDVAILRKGVRGASARRVLRRMK